MVCQYPCFKNSTFTEAHTDWRRELSRKQLASALSVRLDSASAKDFNNYGSCKSARVYAELYG